MENEEVVQSNEQTEAPVEQTEVVSETKKEKKKNIWKRFTEWEYSYMFVCFFLPFLILLGAYAGLGTHPFGNNSVLTLDLQGQYIYYFEAVRDNLLKGGSWLYSWQRTLGGEFMGIVDYYMGSFFNLVIVLFPKKMIADAVMFIELLKVGSMGVTFAYYLHKTRRPGTYKTIAFSMMYALCAYSIVNLMNPMWLDAVILLPLVVLGVEKLIRYKKVGLYIASMALVFITNYYIGYMVGIFTLFYYVYYSYIVSPELDAGRKKKEKFFQNIHVRNFIRFGISTVVAICIGAFWLYSAYYSLQFGKIGFSNPTFDFTLKFDLLDFFIKLLPGSYDTVHPNGLPMVYSGILALVCLPLFFASKKISRRHKAAAGVMVSALIVSMLVNAIDLVWHGFSAPNWLNARYSFVFSFFIIVMAVDAFNGLKDMKIGVVAGVAGGMALVVMIIQKLNIVWDQGDDQLPLDDAGCILLSVVLLVVYILVIDFMRRDKTKSTAGFILVVIVAAEMFASSIITIGFIHEDVGVTRYNNYLSSSGKTEYYSSYNGSIQRIEGVVNQVLESDKSLYRMESTVYRRAGGNNEQMAFGFNGISHSTSTLNKPIINMMAKLGYSSTSHWTKYIGGTPVSDALLGIKYVITKDDTLDSSIYTVAAQGKESSQLLVTESTIYALKNTKALSFAYGVSQNFIEDLKESIYPPYITSLEYQNKMINSMLSGTDYSSGDIFVGITAAVDTVDCSMSTFTQKHKYYYNDEEKTASNLYYSFSSPSSDNAKAVFDFTSPVTGTIYYHFPSANFGMKADVYVNGKYLVEYFTNESNCILKLGDFKKGESVSVELKFKSTNIYISKASKYYFYYVDYAALNDAFSYLESSELYIEKFGNDYIKGNINLAKGQDLIFTSIPYDKGWNAFIDGKKVETVEVMDSLLAIQSTEGYHTVELRYMPKGYVITIIISVVSCLLFAAYLVFTLNKKARKWIMTKVFKKECAEQDNCLCDLSPIGEYEEVFGESKYRHLLFPDDNTEQPEATKEKTEESEVKNEEQTSNDSSDTEETKD